jgi:hypothetical protein
MISIAKALNDWKEFKKNRLQTALQKAEECPITKIEQDYINWVKQDLYADIYKKNLTPKGMEHRFAYMKLPKRGNNIYARKTQKRFNQYLLPIAHLASQTDFFHQREGFTRYMFITLTFDSKKATFSHAWKNIIAKEWNRFLSCVKKKYGAVYTVMRTFESTLNGYPHIHALLYFDEHEFMIYKVNSYRNDKTGRKNWKKYPFNEVNEDFKCYWTVLGEQMHIKLELVSEIHKGLDYIGKYIVKGVGQTVRPVSKSVNSSAPSENGVAFGVGASAPVGVLGSERRGKSSCSRSERVLSDDDKKMLRTVSLMWKFRKRSFSLSYKFKGIVFKALQDYNSLDLIKNYSLFQTNRVGFQFTLLDKVGNSFFSTNNVGSPMWRYEESWHFIAIREGCNIRSWKKRCANFFYHTDHEKYLREYLKVK